MSIENPDIAPMNSWASREQVKALLEHLDHDPHRVSRMVVEPNHIEVVYVHPIRNGWTEPKKVKFCGQRNPADGGLICTMLEGHPPPHGAQTEEHGRPVQTWTDAHD